MKTAAVVRRPSSLSKLYVYIDKYDDLNLTGLLIACGGEITASFCSLHELFLKAESAFDSMGFPNAAFDNRSFVTQTGIKASIIERCLCVGDKLNSTEGDCKATFVIHVKYRQNATWQGVIKWVNMDKTQFFRSELELIKLMDDALNEEYGKDDRAQWE